MDTPVIDQGEPKILRVAPDPKDRPKIAQDGLRFAQDGPRLAQDEPRNAPRCPQEFSMGA